MRKCELLKNNKIFEIFILGTVTLVLTLLFIWLIGTKSLLTLMVLSIITAPPIAVIAAKYDEFPALAAAAVVFGVIWMVYSLPTALVEVISFGVAGLSVGYAFRNKFMLKQTMVLGGMAYALEFILINLVSIRFYNTNLIQDIFINGAIIPFMNMAVQSLKDSEEQIFLLINSILINIPAIITITSFISGFIIVIISLFITRRAGCNVNSIEPFSEFKLSINVVWISIIVQVLAVSNVEGNTIDRFTMVFSNLSYILNFFFMIQGIALADFFLKKWGLQGLLRIIVYFIGGIIIAPFIFIPLLPFVLTIVGVLDSLVDFRKLEAR